MYICNAIQEHICLNICKTEWKQEHRDFFHNSLNRETSLLLFLASTYVYQLQSVFSSQWNIKCCKFLPTQPSTKRTVSSAPSSCFQFPALNLRVRQNSPVWQSSLFLSELWTKREKSLSISTFNSQFTRRGDFINIQKIQTRHKLGTR